MARFPRLTWLWMDRYAPDEKKIVFKGVSAIFFPTSEKGAGELTIRAGYFNQAKRLKALVEDRHSWAFGPPVNYEKFMPALALDFEP